MKDQPEDIPIMGNEKGASVLKKYYAQYLTEVRGLKYSSVLHYFDALNNISRRLKAKGIVEYDIYEIKDIEFLRKARDELYSDPDFIKMNERGKRMYSSGLNNYIRFATGEEFKKEKEKILKMDIPVLPEKPIIMEQTIWKRSNILRVQVINNADYLCEIDAKHETFISGNSGKPYMEGHHAIPMRYQGAFDRSLDVYANIVCLCPLCHRKIHYGIRADKAKMVHQIYADRAERLANSGIKLSRDEFTEIATRELIV